MSICCTQNTHLDQRRRHTSLQPDWNSRLRQSKTLGRICFTVIRHKYRGDCTMWCVNFVLYYMLFALSGRITYFGNILLLLVDQMCVCCRLEHHCNVSQMVQLCRWWKYMHWLKLCLHKYWLELFNVFFFFVLKFEWYLYFLFTSLSVIIYTTTILQLISPAYNSQP